MSSLYAKYLTERTDDIIVETEQGFATYRFLNEKQVYIVDIFVLPEFRKQGEAAKMADRICDIARNCAYIEVLGTVNPSCKNATESISVLIAYGMKVDSCSNNLIVFKKRL